MKIVVTGIYGQLGYDVMKVLAERNIEAIGADKKDFDITNYSATNQFIKNIMPDVVIHCSAYTDVNKAEDEQDLCREVNVEGTENIAKVCKEIDAKMIYISTDYVFSGIQESDKPYEIDDRTEPLSIYGKTKLEGENVVKKILKKYFIVRTSWVFGLNGNNFIKTMLRIGKEKEEVNVVCDQIGSPTYTFDLAVVLCDMAVSEKYGTYHATNEEFCSWAELAKMVFSYANYKTKVNFITTDQYPSKVIRPFNSRLSKKSLDIAGFKRLPNWENAVKRYIDELIK